MQSKEWMQLIKLATKDLAEAVEAYEKSERKTSIGYVYHPNLPLHYSKEAIKRRIVTLRQDLKQLEDAL